MVMIPPDSALSASYDRDRTDFLIGNNIADYTSGIFETYGAVLDTHESIVTLCLNRGKLAIYKSILYKNVMIWLNSRAAKFLAVITRKFHPPGINRILRFLYSPDILRSQNRGLKTLTTCNGFKIQVDTSSHIEWSIFFYGSYEKKMMSLIQKYITPESVCVDIGANIGLHTLELSRGKQVFAFEPEPSVAKKLEKNIALNGVENAKVIPLALSDKSGEAILHTFADKNANEGSASLYLGHSGETKDVIIQMTRLDDYFENLTRLDFIKIDTEGNDLKVLLGGRNIINRLRPIIIFEWHRKSWLEAGNTFEDARSFLNGLNYKLFNIMEDSLSEQIDAEFANILALPSK
jgi:FkbM family methyltransferase